MKRSVCSKRVTESTVHHILYIQVKSRNAKSSSTYQYRNQKGAESAIPFFECGIEGPSNILFLKDRKSEIVGAQWKGAIVVFGRSSPQNVGKTCLLPYILSFGDMLVNFVISRTKNWGYTPIVNEQQQQQNNTDTDTHQQDFWVAFPQYKEKKTLPWRVLSFLMIVKVLKTNKASWFRF